MKILKIGGSFITNKSGYKSPNSENIESFANAVSLIWHQGVHDFILVHGAGSFGHPLVIKYKINDGVKSPEQKLGFADTHASCTELSSMLVAALVRKDVPAISISPNSIIEQKNKRISKFNKKLVLDYLKKGFLPILYGDAVPDTVLEGSVCSGDQIIAHLAKDAEFAVLATNVDGVLDREGKVIEKITKKNFNEIKKHLLKTENDVTGGMEGKLRELLALKTPSYIVNAANGERVIALMMGKKAICTEVRKE
ncbi:isopentenyl phosphate kinase family protein [Candidatus Micrarchaeota archaeon]|nr:isopentenyl phosphate kinase family protein [Candidatus Micrarchaeota archaeon]